MLEYLFLTFILTVYFQRGLNVSEWYRLISLFYAQSSLYQISFYLQLYLTCIGFLFAITSLLYIQPHLTFNDYFIYQELLKILKNSLPETEWLDVMVWIQFCSESALRCNTSQSFRKLSNCTGRYLFFNFIRQRTR